MKQEKNYGIEILRLVLMYMVCILHTLGQGGILHALTKGTISYGVFWFLEIISYCAVDGFAIISGYVANNKPKKYEKIVNIWFQVLFYSLFVTIILVLLGINYNLNFNDIVENLFPITNKKYWYATAYFGLFFLMPVFNKFLFNLSDNTSKRVLVVLILIISVIGFNGDPFIMNDGYSVLWLSILYCIGILIKKIELFKTKRTSSLVLLIIVNTFIVTGFKVFLGIDEFVNYVSPFILFNAILLVILFSRITIKCSKITKISSLVFGIYLFQLNQVIWNNVIQGAFSFVVNKRIYISILYVFVISFFIFICGMFIEFIRQIIARKIKIEVLSKKIITAIDKALKMVCIFLK